MRTRILIIDDDPDQLALLTHHVEAGRQFRTMTADGGAEGLERVAEEPPDLVLCDLMMPEMDGIAFTARLRESRPTLPVIIVTAKGSEEEAERAFEAGATDFVRKPVVPSVLRARIQRALEEVPRRELLQEAEKARFDPDAILGEHALIEEVRRFVQEVASVRRAPVLLLGESGTGKNLVARAIHAAGEGPNRRFVEINCAAVPESLLEAELFGHEKGAFTDARETKRGLAEVADQGTLFLDEIGSMPPSLQAKLLTFLESRSFRRLGGTEEIEVDLRVIAATNANLEEMVEEEAFREDLYFRLNVASHTLPPLRRIRSDIPLLARHFVRKAAEFFRKPVPELDPASLERLMAYEWPGNVRELRNLIERAMIFRQGEVLEIPLPSPDPAAVSEAPPGEGGLVLPLGLTLEEVEKRYIEATMERADRVSDAAEQLGVSRKVLWARRRDYGLLPEDG